jgi:hypothetical protein
LAEVVWRMSKDMSPVAVVFRGLSDAFDELSTERVSPLNVRTTFSNFLELSYRLTQVMCKEYYRRTGGKWEANKFNGWDKVSEFFQRLRTIDTPEHPVLIQVYERRFYGIAEDSTDTLVLEWTWSLGDPHSNYPPEGIRLTVTNPNIGQAHKLIPRRAEYQFYLCPLSEEVDADLLELGDRNIYRLCEKYFDTLKKYYSYYQERLTAQ